MSDGGSVIVSVNGVSTSVEMTGVTTAKEANARFAAAGVGSNVMALTPAEAENLGRRQEAAASELQRELDEARRWHEALAAKLRFTEDVRIVELTRAEAEVLLASLDPDYSDE